MRIDLEATGDNSPYIEALNTYVKKQPTDKYIRTIWIDVIACVQGSERSTPQIIIDELEAILAASTDLSVVIGSEGAIVMEPYKEGGAALTWGDNPERMGTAYGKNTAQLARLVLVEV